MHSLTFLLTGAFLPLVLATIPTKPFHLRTQITPDEPFRYLTSDSSLSLTHHVGLTYDSESETIKSTSSSDILYIRPNQAPQYSLELGNPQEDSDPSSLIIPGWEFENHHLIGSWFACKDPEGDNYSLYLDPQDADSCTSVKLEAVYDHVEKDVEYITTSHVEFIKTGTWNTTVTRTFTTHKPTGTGAPGGDDEDDCDIVTTTSTKTDHTDCHCTSTGSTAGTGSVGWSTSTSGYWNGTTTQTGGWGSSTTAAASATGTGGVAVPTQPVENMPIDSGAGSFVGSWKPAFVVACIILGAFIM